MRVFLSPDSPLRCPRIEESTREDVVFSDAVGASELPICLVRTVVLLDGAALPVVLESLCDSPPPSKPFLSEGGRLPLPPALALPPPRPRPRVVVPRKADPGSLFPPQLVEGGSSLRPAHIDAPVPFAAVKAMVSWSDFREGKMVCFKIADWESIQLCYCSGSL